MQISSDSHKKLTSAYELLQGDVISFATFEHIRILLKGIHPVVDTKLTACSEALDALQKIQDGDMISLSAEALPENSEKEKKRKKAVLFFLGTVKDLQKEIQRVDAEFSRVNNSTQSQAA